jgi:Zn-dependent protease
MYSGSVPTHPLASISALSPPAVDACVAATRLLTLGPTGPVTDPSAPGNVTADACLAGPVAPGRGLAPAVAHRASDRVSGESGCGRFRRHAPDWGERQGREAARARDVWPCRRSRHRERLVVVHESVRLGRVAGITIGANWSLLVIAGLLTWILGDTTLPAAAPHYGVGAYWLTAVVVTTLFFAGLLAHELAHSLVARRRGVEVDRITLWLFGGVSQLRGEAASPAAEFRIAVVGPLMSLGVAVGFGALAVLMASLGGPALAVAAAAWLGGINLLLAVFNLAPAAPLDGGRILHATVWRRSGSHERATEVATRAGRWFGYGLIGLGVLLLLAGDITAVWFVLIGWFLIGAAGAEATHELLRGALGGLVVRDVMGPDPIVAPDTLPVRELVEDWFLGRGHSAFPLVDAEGRVDGLVTLRGARRADTNSPSLTARDLADDLSRVARVGPDDNLEVLLARTAAARGGDGRALVFSGDNLVGIVSPSDLQRALDVAALQRRHPRLAGAQPDAIPGRSS